MVNRHCLIMPCPIRHFADLSVKLGWAGEESATDSLQLMCSGGINIRLAAVIFWPPIFMCAWWYVFQSHGCPKLTDSIKGFPWMCSLKNMHPTKRYPNRCWLNVNSTQSLQNQLNTDFFSMNAMMTSSNRNIFRVTSLLALCEGKSPATGKFPSRRPVTRSFDVFFDLCLNKRLSKQPRGWWFETPLRPLWRHSNGDMIQTWSSRCRCSSSLISRHSDHYLPILTLY